MGHRIVDAIIDDEGRVNEDAWDRGKGRNSS